MSGPWRSLKRSIRNRLALRLRQLVSGPECIFPGDPRWRVDVHPTSSVNCKLIVHPGDREVPLPTFGRYSGVHYTTTFFVGGLHHVEWVSPLHLRRVGGLDGPQRMPSDMIFSHGPITVGSDVWIAYEAMVMSGVSIGDGAVVAARSLVTRDVAPFEIVGGTPAKHIGWRFDEPTREALLRIRWWDWPYDKVEANRHLIDSDDLAGFIAAHDPAR